MERATQARRKRIDRRAVRMAAMPGAWGNGCCGFTPRDGTPDSRARLEEQTWPTSSPSDVTSDLLRVTGPRHLRSAVEGPLRPGVAVPPRLAIGERVTGSGRGGGGLVGARGGPAVRPFGEIVGQLAVPGSGGLGNGTLGLHPLFDGSAAVGRRV